MRKLIALFLVILLLFALLPISAMAADKSDLSRSISDALAKVISSIRPQESIGTLRTLFRQFIHAVFWWLPDIDPVTPGDPPHIEANENYFDDGVFKPVLSFAVASDVHIADLGSETREKRLAELFHYASALGAELAVFAGDISDSGTITSMQKAKRIMDANRDGIDLLCMLGNHESMTGPLTPSLRFRAIFGQASRGHIIRNGFHFIYLSPDAAAGWDFSEASVSWLEKELAKAAKADPYKPIFVFHHEHVYGTVYGSKNWGVAALYEALSKYPQVVDFSGHSHFPVNDPRSIWQGAFTAVGTGSLNYYEVGLNGVTDGFLYSADAESGEYSAFGPYTSDADTFWLVEVNAVGSVRMTAYHVDNRTEIVRYGIREPWNPSSFTYTDDRYEASEVPVFGEDAEITESDLSTRGFTVTFPTAACADIVESYRIELWKDGKLTQTERRLSLTFYANAPKSFTVPFSGLGDDETYTVKVYAVSSFGKESEPLKKDISLPLEAEPVFEQPNEEDMQVIKEVSDTVLPDAS